MKQTPQGTFWVEAPAGHNNLVAAGVGYLNSAPNFRTYVFEIFGFDN
jgi:hypothetical protein